MRKQIQKKEITSQVIKILNPDHLPSGWFVHNAYFQCIKYGLSHDTPRAIQTCRGYLVFVCSVPHLFEGLTAAIHDILYLWSLGQESDPFPSRKGTLTAAFGWGEGMIQAMTIWILLQEYSVWNHRTWRIEMCVCSAYGHSERLLVAGEHKANCDCQMGWYRAPGLLLPSGSAQSGAILCCA